MSPTVDSVDLEPIRRRGRAQRWAFGFHNVPAKYKGLEIRRVSEDEAARHLRRSLLAARNVIHGCDVCRRFINAIQIDRVRNDDRLALDREIDLAVRAAIAVRRGRYEEIIRLESW